MANELVHVTVGTQISQAEYESVVCHQFNNQAQGDIPYASDATHLVRLAAGGTAGGFLKTGGAAANPSWSTVLNEVDGRIGIGAVATSGKLAVVETREAPASGEIYGIVSDFFVQETGSATAAIAIGIVGAATLTAANTQNWTSQYGLIGLCGWAYTVTGATGTVTGMAAIVAGTTCASTVTNCYGIKIDDVINTGTLTNDYGIYIAGIGGA